MLLTVPWVLAIVAGRVDLKGGKPNYRASPKLTNEDIGFGGMFVTGCGGSQAVREGGGVMMVTAVSYVIIQMPTFFVHDDESLVAAQKIASLIALFTSTALFFGYIWYQNRLSMADQEVSTSRRTTPPHHHQPHHHQPHHPTHRTHHMKVTLRKQLSATIACIKAKKLTLKSAMYSDLAVGISTSVEVRVELGLGCGAMYSGLAVRLGPCLRSNPNSNSNLNCGPSIALPRGGGRLTQVL